MKVTARLLMGLLIVGVACSIGHARKKMKGEDLSNMIIEGENRLRVHGTVPEMPWDVDAYKDVPEALRDYVLLGELKSPSIHAPPLMLPAKTSSQKAASPWHNDIVEPPVLTLSFTLENEIRKPKWMFVVRDSHGKPFFQLNRTGNLPDSIVWDGLGNNRKPLRVGYDYSYLMTIIDEAGNPKRFSGRPFRLTSFRYVRSGRSVNMISPDSLFTDDASIRFSDIGRSKLIEVKDYLRTRYGGRVDINVYDNDLKFAASRANVIRDYFVRALDIPETRVTAQGLPLSQGDGYKHVDIIAK